MDRRLVRDQKIAFKTAQNRTKQRLRNLLNKYNKNIPPWLEVSGRSILERTEDISRIASTPRRVNLPPNIQDDDNNISDIIIGDNDIYNNNRGGPAQRKKNRRFTKRNKYRKWGEKMETIRNNIPDLFTNFSSYTLSEGQRKLLNKGGYI